jgi:hypothetical protein
MLKLLFSLLFWGGAIAFLGSVVRPKINTNMTNTSPAPANKYCFFTEKVLLDPTFG